jgi:hypothetical protein
MILDNINDAGEARAALSAAFDDPAVTELRVFNLGAGEPVTDARAWAPTQVIWYTSP